MLKQPYKKIVNVDKLEELIAVARNILWHWEVEHICINFNARNCMTELEEALEAMEEEEGE